MKMKFYLYILTVLLLLIAFGSVFSFIESDKIRNQSIDLIVNACPDDCNKEDVVDSYTVKYSNSHLTKEYVDLTGFDHIHRALYSDNVKYFCAKKGSSVFVIKAENKNNYVVEIKFLPAEVFIFDDSLLLLQNEENKAVLHAVNFEKKSIEVLIDNIELSEYKHNNYVEYNDTVFVNDKNIVYKNTDGLYYRYSDEKKHNKIDICSRVFGFNGDDTVICADNFLFEDTEFSVDSIVEVNLNDETKSFKRLILFKPLDCNVISPDGRYILTLSGNGEGMINAYVYDLYSLASAKMDDSFVIDVFKNAQWR